MALAEISEYNHPFDRRVLGNDRLVTDDLEFLPDNERRSLWIGTIATPNEVLAPDLFLEQKRYRFREYTKRNFLPPEAEDEHGGESDEYDAQSYEFIALENSRIGESSIVRGSGRLIIKGSDMATLPVEDMYDFTVPNNSAEASRFIATNCLPVTQRTVVMGLMRCMISSAYKEEIEKVYAAVERPFMARFKMIGIPYDEVEEIAPRELEKYGNTTNHVIVFDPPRVVDSILKRDPSFEKPWTKMFVGDIANTEIGFIDVE